METNNVEILTIILKALNGLDKDTQKRTIDAVITFLGLNVSDQNFSIIRTNNIQSESEVAFSANRNITPKEFLRDKMPKTDLERITCLAYYLTHYRETPHFKTIDLSTLNIEAAQPKLSNPTNAVENATKAGFLVQAIKGTKQLSAVGELFVQALPNREAARESIANIRTKRRPKKSAPKKTSK